jgi:hypothetical protein
MSMNDGEIKFDHFEENILKKIDRNIVKTFTPEQLSEIKSAYNKWWNQKPSHAIDIRGVIPLIFKRYYFCFLLGEDKRFSAKQVELDRRNEKSGSSLVGILFWGFVLMIILAFSLFFVFIFSSPFIDILPKK